MDDAVAVTLSKIHEFGQALHKEYLNTRPDKIIVPLSDTIKRNNMFTFANRLDPRKKESKVGILKHNTMLIIQPFLSLQSRPDADMLEFFKFENQREPSALSDRSSLRAGTKSDILKCTHAPIGHAIPATQATVQVKAAIIHMVPPTRALTFNGYVPLHIVPFLKAQMTTTVQRIDAVWDTYAEQNLKSQTQQRRGSGARTRLESDGDGSTPIPKRDWQSYLKMLKKRKRCSPLSVNSWPKQTWMEFFSLAPSLRKCSPTSHLMCQHSSPATMQKQIRVSSCI